MDVKKEWLNWLASGDTGISSETMFSALTGVPVNRHDIPYDIADVGRCIRMLEKLPDLRPHLEKVIIAHKEWMPYIDCWKEIESRYKECIKWQALPEEEKKRLKRQKHFYVPNDTFWELMQQLQCASRYLDGMRMQNSSTSWRNAPPDKF